MIEPSQQQVQQLPSFQHIKTVQGQTVAGGVYQQMQPSPMYIPAQVYNLSNQASDPSNAQQFHPYQVVLAVNHSGLENDQPPVHPENAT